MYYRAIHKILARRIFLKKHKLSDFKEELHEGIKAAYLDMYCEDCPIE